QMMTLHEAAGGKAYTGLDHASLRTFDLTPLLWLDRAVLIARVPEPQTEWHFTGKARRPTPHHGFVRPLLPVPRQSVCASGLRQLTKFGKTGMNQTPDPNAKSAPNENPNAPSSSEKKSP